MSNRLAANHAALFLILLFSFSAFAQSPKPKPTATPAVEEESETIRVNSRLVVVPVSVTDAGGQPILGLKTQDFRLLEENKPQEIAQVSDAEKVPLEIALLFDISATTYSMFEYEQETAAKFLREVMRPEDRATIFTIGSAGRMIQARDSADKSAASIQTIRPTKEYTAFYDTVRDAADYLQKNAPRGRRKVIIVISDGDDTSSEGVRKGFQTLYNSPGYDLNKLTPKMLADKRDQIKTREQSKVLQSLQNADAVFYSINPGGNSYQLNKSGLFGQSNLQRFADQTGGTAFLPKFQPTTLKDNLQNSYNVKFNQESLTKIFRQLANELQAQYLVQYYSDGEFPIDKYVKLEVGLQNQNKLRVRARQGYFVKN